MHTKESTLKRIEDLHITTMHIDGETTLKSINVILNTLEELDKKYPIERLREIIENKEK